MRAFYILLFAMCFCLTARQDLRGQSFYRLFLSPSNEKNISERENYFRINYSGYPVVDYSGKPAKELLIEERQWQLFFNWNLEPLRLYAEYLIPESEIYYNEMGDAGRDSFLFSRKHRSFLLRADYDFTLFQLYLGALCKNGILFGEAALEYKSDWGNLKIMLKQSPFDELFEYSVQQESGEIKAVFLIQKIGMEFQNEFIKLGAYLSTLKNRKNDQEIHSIVKGNLWSLNLGVNWDKFSSSLLVDCVEDIEVWLYQDESPFGHLDKFQYLHYLFSVRYDFIQAWNISLGITGFDSEIGDKTYFEIWPFTFWDIFLASKTRINNLDIALHLPFLTLDYHQAGENDAYSYKWGAGVSYYLFLMQEQFVISERVWDAYPFVSHYEQRDIDLKPEIDGIVRLKFYADFRYKNLELSFFLSQLIPVQFSKIFSQNSAQNCDKTDNEEERLSGGTFFSVSLTQYF